MSKFKVGDEVILVEVGMFAEVFNLGDEAEIFDIDRDGDLWVTNSTILKRYPNGLCQIPKRLVLKAIYNSPLYKAMK